MTVDKHSKECEELAKEINDWLYKSLGIRLKSGNDIDLAKHLISKLEGKVDEDEIIEELRPRVPQYYCKDIKLKKMAEAISKLPVKITLRGEK